jgi:hypothetical protein
MTAIELQSWLIERTTEDGECLIWTRGVNSSGHPVGTVNGKYSQSIRRFVALKAGKHVTARYVVVNSCGHLRCVNPDHLSPVSHGTKTKLAWERGLINEPVFRANHARAAQSRSKLNWDDVRAIRLRNADGKSMASLAREYGVCVAAIHAICRHKRWADAGPFAQLLSR